MKNKDKLEHVCRNRPSFRKGSNPWVKGSLDDCPYHGQKLPTHQPDVKGIPRQ